MPFASKIAVLSRLFLEQSADFTPTADEFVSWVDSQPLPVRPLLYVAGPSKCWAGLSPSFQAWVLDARGVSFADYLVKHLSETDYLRWVEMYATTTLGRES